MSDKKIECLGIEFYRNYIGIKDKNGNDNPLEIEEIASGHLYDFMGLDATSKGDIILIRDYENGSDHDLYNSSYFKPHLKLPEDLTDEELICLVPEVFRDDCVIERYMENCHDKIFIMWDEVIALVEFNLSCNWFGALEYTIDQQDILDGLHSLHCSLKAKEYIDNNLAVRKI
jgi:hypothetical protein